MSSYSNFSTGYQLLRPKAIALGPGAGGQGHQLVHPLCIPFTVAVEGIRRGLKGSELKTLCSKALFDCDSPLPIRETRSRFLKKLSQKERECLDKNIGQLATLRSTDAKDNSA